MKTREIQVTINLLNLLDFKELETKSIKSLMSLMKKLSEKEKESSELQIKILQAYDVKMENNNYVWKGHEKEEEINKKIEEVLNDDMYKEIKPLLNFMTDEEFISCAKDKLNLAQMMYLEEYLVKTQKN